MSLHMFTDHTNTVIAENVDDAMGAWSEHTGGEPEDHQEDHGAWEEIPANTLITIWCDSDGDPCSPEEDGAEELTKTAAEWIAAQGHGFLCTTDI